MQLAALFLDEDSFQLIDEPTNHLDARSIAGGGISETQTRFILVRHDRQVLDACTDHIMALGRDGIEICRGSYSAWLENVQRRQNDEEVQNEQLKKDIRRLREAARRTSGWSDQVEASKRGAADKGYVGHKAAKMMKRSKAIEARCEAAIAEKRSLLRHVERMDE
ncbi:MAG: Lsa family ABC-F type ribosomal protection protein, partial [Merdibacter sp.]